VIIRLWNVWEKLFSRIAWWAHVTDTPEDNKIIVLSSGTWKALNGEIPVGGHKSPVSNVGDRLLWKNAQKKEKKNKTSEVINSIIPHLRPFITMCV